jgi:hypothetical protein
METTMSNVPPFARTVAGIGAGYEANGLIWSIAPWTGGSGRIYANGYAKGTTPSAMSKKNIVRRAYVWFERKSGRARIHGESTSEDGTALFRWFEGYLAAIGLTAADIPQQWKDVVVHCNGAGNRRAVDKMASATVRRKTYSQIFGVRGTQYPPSAAMIDSLGQMPVPTGWNAVPWFVAPPMDEAPAISAKGDDALASAMADQPAPAPVSPDPAPAPAFDPDAMTHRDLVDLARKGHGADAAIRAANTATSAAIDEWKTALSMRDTAIAERDEAIKRAALTTPVKVEVTKGDGTVEISGVTLPTFNGGHGPKPTDGYDLLAWRAEMKVGDFEVTASAPHVAASIMAGDSVRLVGPPSVGKTSGIREVCALTGAKFFLIPCGEGATDLSLIAERVIDNGGKFVWRDGHVTAAVRWAIANPSVLCVAVLDEVDHLLPEVQSLMHSVLEGGHLCVNSEETLTVPSNIRFVATANTTGHGDMTGHHASAKVSDTAFTSRWNATYTVTYLPPDAEARLLVASGAQPDLAKAAVELAGMTRTDGASVNQPVVLRQLLAWARACGRGEDPRSAWGWRIMASSPEHDRPALRELTRNCFNW